MKTKIDEFEKIRYEVQVMSFQGDKQDKEKMKKLQEMYDILMKEPKIKEYFDIEVRFNIMLADVNKIISESVKDFRFVFDEIENIVNSYKEENVDFNEKTIEIFLKYNIVTQENIDILKEKGKIK